MRKVLVLAALAGLALSANAKSDKDTTKVNKNAPVFTVIKENPITSVKDQNRSGTCWAYSTLSFFESEILKKTGKTYDL
jgi:C1A family cysteine protease